MERIDEIIDYILFNGHIITSNSKGLLYNQLYSDKNLHKLVIKPLRNYIFHEFDRKHIEDFNFTDNMASADHEFSRDNCIYSSFTEILDVITCVLCNQHMAKYTYLSHECNYSKNAAGLNIECNNHSSYKSSSINLPLRIPDKSNDSLPEEFISRLAVILKHVCNFLEKIFSNDYPMMMLEFKRMESCYHRLRKFKASDPDFPPLFEECIAIISDEDKKLCLLVFNDELHDFTDIISCFEVCVPTKRSIAEFLSKELDSHGYTCLLFQTFYDDCLMVKDCIENFFAGTLSDSSHLCKIVTVQTLYSMRLSHVLVGFISMFCNQKPQMCDLLAHVLFRDTFLAEVYVKNERFLWKKVREDMLYKMFSCVFCSEYGKSYLSKLYLKYLETIYSDFLIDDHDIAYCFLNLNSRFFKCQSITTYLIRNEFLSKMLDFLTRHLNKMGISKGVKIMELFMGDYLRQSRLKRVFVIFKSFLQALLTPFKNEILSLHRNFVMQKTVSSLIDFCFAFDDLEPLKKTQGSREHEIYYSYTVELIHHIHNIMINLCDLLYSCYDALCLYSDMLLRISKENAFEFLPASKKSDTMFNLLTYYDVENENFSIFNLSRRLIFDALVYAITNDNYCFEGKFFTIFDDEIMLIWLSSHSVTSIASYINYISTDWNLKNQSLASIYRLYRHPENFHCFYLQDFTVIQILISFMPPDRFIKYMLFNLFPNVRRNSDFTQPLSFILSFTEVENDVAIRELLSLIYNALSERHFIGKIDDYKYFLTERQLLHYLARGDQTLKNISQKIYFRSEYYTVKNDVHIEYLNDAINKVAYIQKSLDGEIKYSLKAEYFGYINWYYFIYSYEQSLSILERLMLLNDSHKYDFELSDIADVRSEFAGINEFIFSREFLQLIFHSLKKLIVNVILSEYTPSDDMMVALTCLCFVLKISKNKKMKSTYPEKISSVFFVLYELDIKNFVKQLIKSRTEIDHPAFCFIIDVFIQIYNSLHFPI